MRINFSWRQQRKVYKIALHGTDNRCSRDPAILQPSPLTLQDKIIKLKSEIIEKLYRKLKTFKKAM